MPFGQGFRDMSPPSKALMKLALEGRLAHGGHPVLSWMVDNIHVRTGPTGNIKPDKQKSTVKIDGVVATIMALDNAIYLQQSLSVTYVTRFTIRMRSPYFPASHPSTLKWSNRKG
ncbi:hypothetical protein JTE88_02605 [Arcanobacterium phocisimile]|uniref:Terminase large subunit-like endonuclease domain-containing protein n=1 Tax=Arcanobacterium phocisimile TaxID=1302235 RepID=A0ABX7IIH2_9ACTO|nr:hypothetical protein JTE88_02605 [Arcanobacterium phocisimile]